MSSTKNKSPMPNPWETPWSELPRDGFPWETLTPEGWETAVQERSFWLVGGLLALIAVDSVQGEAVFDLARDYHLDGLQNPSDEPQISNATQALLPIMGIRTLTEGTNALRDELHFPMLRYRWSTADKTPILLMRHGSPDWEHTMESLPVGEILALGALDLICGVASVPWERELASLTPKEASYFFFEYMDGGPAVET